MSTAQPPSGEDGEISRTWYTPEEMKWDGPRGNGAHGNGRLPDSYYAIEGRFHSVFWNLADVTSAPSYSQERTMNKLSTLMRMKPRWWEKVFQDEILEKWRDEAQGVLDRDAIDRVIKELRHLAETRVSPASRPSPVDGVFESDDAVPKDVLEELRQGAVALAAVIPRDEHPGSDGLVIDLVHPSLYCFVSDRSFRVPELMEGLVTMPPLPRRFQWLPAIFRVSEEDGSARAVSPIHNLDGGRHPALVAAVERAFAACVPALEDVLLELRRKGPMALMRSSTRGVDVNIYRMFETVEEFAERQGLEEGTADSDGEEFDEDAIIDRWTDEKELKRPPRLLPFEPPAEPPAAVRTRLAGRDLRVIVKLANIELTPERPAYPGGTWHVEGEPQEAIVATAIVYYDMDNVTESLLGFRRPVDAMDIEYEQDDWASVDAAYGLDWHATDDRAATVVEELGSAVAQPGRIICFPNTLQHRVAPFRLTDPTRAGHRKILAFFLVDPAVPIVSTRELPAQRSEDLAALLTQLPRFANVPEAVVAHIVDLVPSAFSRKDAEAYRAELMDARRSANASLVEDFESDFSLCEH